MRTLFHKVFPEKSDWNFQKADLSEDKRKLENPSRGWYRIYTFEVEKVPDFQPMLWNALEGDTLVMVILNIGAYKEKALDAMAVEHVRSILGFFSKRQYEIILRITYDHEGRALEREPFFFSTVTGHMQQILPVVNEFAEWVFVYQGLHIGNWGEMHTSRFLHPLKMKELWRILKTETAEGFFFAVRKPSYWRLLHPDGGSDRMGLFDDAIFGSESHLGTFGMKEKEFSAWDEAWCKADELMFEEQLCQMVPNGGEAICGELYLSQETPFSTVETLRKMHISYLNKEYDKKLLRIWKEWKWDGQDVWQGSMLYDYIESHLGYRFLVKDVKIDDLNDKTDIICVHIYVQNEGFACCYEEAEVLFEYINDRGIVVSQVIDSDVRLWRSREEKEIIVELPAEESKIFMSIHRKRDGRAIYLANQTDSNGRVFLGQIKDGQVNT